MSKLCPKKLISLGLFLIFGLAFALLVPQKAVADGLPYVVAIFSSPTWTVQVQTSQTILTSDALTVGTAWAVCSPDCTTPAKASGTVSTLGTFTAPWGAGAGPGGTGTATSLSAVADYFKRIINVVTAIAILIFLVMMFVGGFQFLFAGGDPKAIARARNTLTFAIIGLIVLLAVWFLLLAIQSVTGVPVTSFNLPTP